MLHSRDAQQKGLRLNANFAENLPTQICIDPTRLRQVINNLLNNAVKFTNVGEITLSANWAGEMLVVGVRDTGPGIDPAAQEVVFERFRQASTFVTREHSGTGLGLALVREIVRLMGGSIHLSSELGQGSYFEFAIPQSDQSQII